MGGIEVEHCEKPNFIVLRMIFLVYHLNFEKLVSYFFKNACLSIYEVKYYAKYNFSKNPYDSK